MQICFFFTASFDHILFDHISDHDCKTYYRSLW